MHLAVVGCGARLLSGLVPCVGACAPHLVAPGPGSRPQPANGCRAPGAEARWEGQSAEAAGGGGRVRVWGESRARVVWQKSWAGCVECVGSAELEMDHGAPGRTGSEASEFRVPSSQRDSGGGRVAQARARAGLFRLYPTSRSMGTLCTIYAADGGNYLDIAFASIAMAVIAYCTI